MILDGNNSLEDESSLVKGIKSRDPKAQSALVKQLLGRFLRRIRCKCKNDEDAEEILNDVALKVIMRIDTFRSDRCKSFWNWVYTIVDNCTSDRIRHANTSTYIACKSVGLGGDLDKLLYENAPNLYRPYQDDCIEEIPLRMRALSVALGQMSERDRIIIEFHFLYQRTDEELAKQINTAVSNLREYRRRALNRLRAHLLKMPEFGQTEMAGDDPSANAISPAP